MTYPYSSICVFCGSACSPDPAFAEAALKMGELLAAQGITLIYGAGRAGMMGAVAEGALRQHGKIIGVTHRYEEIHTSHMEGLSRLEVMESLEQRKARMTDIADAFIILPGGYGTMDEFFEVLALSQVGLHRKPIALLNVKGYFDLLVAWIEHAAAENFICPEHADLFIVDSDPIKLMKRLADFQFPKGNTNWLKESQD